MFAEMLPFLDRRYEGLYQSINRDNAWFEGDNLKAGEAWVPELLVPSYPSSSWRATSPFVPDGRVLGADARVLHRHLPAGERYEPGARPDVAVVQGRALQGLCVGHARPTLAQRPGGSP